MECDLRALGRRGSCWQLMNILGEFHNVSRD